LPDRTDAGILPDRINRRNPTICTRERRLAGLASLVQSLAASADNGDSDDARQNPTEWVRVHIG
jgi:hypothetical protein